jgi:UDP-3-O-acyl-N-acetylglucosamine deacetylase
LETPQATVELVEHVLAALSGLRIDNCVIEIEASEMPGCDGSSGPFVQALLDAGIVEQSAMRSVFVVDRTYAVSEGDATLAIHPSGSGEFEVSYSLDYGRGGPIGRQSFSVVITPESFREELATARTFLLAEEVSMLRAQGIGARTGPRDLLIFGPDGPIDNALRFPEEPARHKILDIVGDLSLFGCDVCGRVVGHKSGHRLNAALVGQLVEAGVQAVRFQAKAA